MPTRGMPERPSLEHFRRQARTLQRAVRAGDPGAAARIAAAHPAPPDADGLPLAAAQLVIAREYGFASWPRLHRYVRTAVELGWDTGLGAVHRPNPADEFCRLACLTYSRDDGPERWARARDLLERHPELTAGSIWAAAAAARPDDVARLLEQGAARGGPLRWGPLFYLVYSRADPHAGADRVLSVARLLLDAGADPNEGYLFNGLPTPFTLLTGVFGAGELGVVRQPPHPHWHALATMLLTAGADPNDAQTLYNRMFEPDDSHLELLFEHGLGTGDGGPWKARIDTLPTPAEMLRVQVRWAVEHGQAGRVRLLGRNGVDLAAPFTADGPPWAPGDARTPLELAELAGDTAMAALLVEHGVPRPAPEPVRDLIAAAFRGDADAVRRLAADHPAAVAEARRRRPGLLVWAAARAGGEAVALLAGLGFDVNALGRGDAPAEGAWETALHHAAANGDVALARRLLDLGADPGRRDTRFGATPLGWAQHFSRAGTIALLKPLTPAEPPE